MVGTKDDFVPLDIGLRQHGLGDWQAVVFYPVDHYMRYNEPAGLCVILWLQWNTQRNMKFVPKTRLEVPYTASLFSSVLLSEFRNISRSSD
jgi:hypothetical protein